MAVSLQQLKDEIMQLSDPEDDEHVKRRLLPLVTDLIYDPSWLGSCHRVLSEEQDWVLHTLFSDPLRTPITVFVTAWKPGGTAPPHTHGSWAIIGVIEGVEKNIIWQRTDDGHQSGYAELNPVQTIHCAVGDVIVLGKDDIHSVSNDSDEISLGLHIYGNHPDRAEREHFDVAKRTVQPFVTIPAA